MGPGGPEVTPLHSARLTFAAPDMQDKPQRAWASRLPIEVLGLPSIGTREELAREAAKAVAGHIPFEGMVREPLEVQRRRLGDQPRQRVAVQEPAHVTPLGGVTCA